MLNYLYSGINIVMQYYFRFHCAPLKHIIHVCANHYISVSQPLLLGALVRRGASSRAPREMTLLLNKKGETGGS